MTTMRKVVISNIIHVKIASLNQYLTQEFQLSKEAAIFRIKRIVRDMAHVTVLAE